MDVWQDTKYISLSDKENFLTFIKAPTPQNSNCLTVFEHFVGLALKGLNKSR